MRRIPRDEPEPGHLEADLVHHCGSTTTGDYLHTLQLIDVATGWSERAALLGRSYRVMKDAFQRILARLPFAIIELHPDNGNEFFNQHLLRFWSQVQPGLYFSRSRPWHKNDNRLVEQKNDTLGRAFFHHNRLDTTTQAQAMNALYDKMWLYYNLFQPVMRQVAKEIITDSDGQRRVRRRFDTARTPFQRLCAVEGALPNQQRAALQSLREETNPRQLRREIYSDLEALFSLPCARPGVSEDIYETLYIPSGKEVDGPPSPVTLSFDRIVTLR